jgi:hypothetical protein
LQTNLFHDIGPLDISLVNQVHLHYIPNEQPRA